jgi:hypothetical protein
MDEMCEYACTRSTKLSIARQIKRNIGWSKVGKSGLNFISIVVTLFWVFVKTVNSEIRYIDRYPARKKTTYILESRE